MLCQCTLTRPGDAELLRGLNKNHDRALWRTELRIRFVSALQRCLFGLGVCLATVIGAADSANDSVPYEQRPEVSAYIDSLVSKHGFDRSELETLLSKAQRKQSILDAISRPAERTLEWKDYRKIFMKDDRIAGGVEFWNQNADVLARAAQQFGVPPEYVVAIIGVETRYGKFMGKYRVLDALATLGFDYPPRSKFFRKELTEYLLMTREEGMDPEAQLGSYAGAMGFGQFISSSFRAYAVDFDGDGVRDILRNKTDAIGSVANYFKRHGWRGDAQVIVPVALQDPATDELANKGEALRHTVAGLRAQGVVIPCVEETAKAALFRMEAEAGTQYWVGLNDFYAITRYNHSSMYALAVHQLAQAIKARRVETP